MNNYKKILKSCPLYYDCSNQITETSSFGITTAYFTAPLLFTYVLWVLKTAQEKNIKRLYFLARDGYVLHKMAKILCKKNKINIDCRYLYCSRVSLRTPSYHLIGDEAFELLLRRGYNLTPYNILMRLNMTEKERKEVYKDILFNKDENEYLSDQDYNNLCKKLRSSDKYKSIMLEKSKTSYENIKNYFIQEGLTENIKFGIVDSGWTGSMQRSMRQILSSFSEVKSLTGFYFGMFSAPKKADEDGEFLTWYFNDKTASSIKAKFNNNVFECMCSAPHGMTLDYKKVNGKYEPIIRNTVGREQININFAKTQSNICCRFAELACVQSPFNLIAEKGEQKMYHLTKKLIENLMYKPERLTVLSLSSFIFCDDISEAYFNTLASHHQEDSIKAYGIFSRIYDRAIKRNKNNKNAELFWAYGSLELSNLKLKSCHRLNMYIWDYLRFFCNRG